MYYINEIELFKKPKNEIIPKINGVTEMTDFESSFLCGIIIKYKPRKCVEVGIAEGGTTAVIMQCLTMIHGDVGDADKPIVYGVDLSEKLYAGGKDKKSGYLAERAKKHLSNVNLKLLLGDVLPNRLSEIGNEIDLVLLDTTHFLPGEALDFLAILPFVSDGG